MGLEADTSILETLLHKVSLQGKAGLSGNILTDKIARGSLLDTLRQLTVALEQPEDVVQRVVFFVRLSL
jgi:hypothetical protein